MLFPQAPKGTTVFTAKILQTSTLSHHWFSLPSALYPLATDVLCKSRYRSAFTLARVPLGALVQLYWDACHPMPTVTSNIVSPSTNRARGLTTSGNRGLSLAQFLSRARRTRACPTARPDRSRTFTPPPTECRHRKKPHGERVVGPQTTRSSCSNGHRRHRRRCPSEHCGHPGTWLKVLELVNHWSRQLSGMAPQLPWPWGGPQ